MNQPNEQSLLAQYRSELLREHIDLIRENWNSFHEKNAGLMPSETLVSANVSTQAEYKIQSCRFDYWFAGFYAQIEGHMTYMSGEVRVFRGKGGGGGLGGGGIFVGSGDFFVSPTQLLQPDYSNCSFGLYAEIIGAVLSFGTNGGPAGNIGNLVGAGITVPAMPIWGTGTWTES